MNEKIFMKIKHFVLTPSNRRPTFWTIIGLMVFSALMMFLSVTPPEPSVKHYQGEETRAVFTGQSGEVDGSTIAVLNLDDQELFLEFEQVPPEGSTMSVYLLEDNKLQAEGSCGKATDERYFCTTQPYWEESFTGSVNLFWLLPLLLLPVFATAAYIGFKDGPLDRKEGPFARVPFWEGFKKARYSDLVTMTPSMVLTALALWPVGSILGYALTPIEGAGSIVALILLPLLIGGVAGMLMSVPLASLIGRSVQGFMGMLKRGTPGELPAYIFEALHAEKLDEMDYNKHNRYFSTSYSQRELFSYNQMIAYLKKNKWDEEIALGLLDGFEGTLKELADVSRELK